MTERFLVTGAAGCLGAWTLARLIEDGSEVLAFDLSDDRRRLRLVVDDPIAQDVPWVTGDIRDLDQVVGIVESHDITHVVHLAALQVPFCKADPAMGSQVNVTGTVNVLESARRAAGQIRGLVYASSVAVFGTADMYEGGIAFDDDPLAPATLYGVYKQANEATARVYFDDWGVSSIGLRPCVVYGPGRDQGLTSSPTVAMLRAAAGLSTHVAFGGSSTYHHAGDVAAAMIAVARMGREGAFVHNIGGTDATLDELAAAIATVEPQVEVTHDDTPLALVSGLDGSGLSGLLGDEVGFRPLSIGVADTIHRFRQLIELGLISPE